MSSVLSKAKKAAARRTPVVTPEPTGPVKRLPQDVTPPKSKSGKQPKKGKATTSTASALLAVARKVLPDGQKHRAALLSEGPPLADVREWIPTGFDAIDEILGGGVEVGGGLAVGRISEVFGPEGSGKSAFTHMAAVGCQRIGGTVVYFDFEASLDANVMEQLGIVPNRLVYVVPDSAESGAQQLKKMVDDLKANPPDAPVLFVWDSVAATPMQEEREKDTKAESYVGAKRANLFSSLARELMTELSPARAHLLFVNQERMDLSGKMFSEPKVPGGAGIKYAASQRVRVQKVKTENKTVKGRKIMTNYIVKFTTRKCRLCPPHQSVELILDFRVGLSPELSMLRHLKDAGVVKRVKGLYVFKFHKEPIGERTFLALLREDPEFVANVREAYKPVALAANWINAPVDTTSDDAGDDAAGDGDAKPDEELDPDVT